MKEKKVVTDKNKYFASDMVKKHFTPKSEKHHFLLSCFMLIMVCLVVVFFLFLSGTRVLFWILIDKLSLSRGVGDTQLVYITSTLSFLSHTLKLHHPDTVILSMDNHKCLSLSLLSARFVCSTLIKISTGLTPFQSSVIFIPLTKNQKWKRPRHHARPI